MDTRFRPARVALMDDDYMARKMVAYLLAKDLQSEVSTEAATPEQLFEGIEAELPDVILIDTEFRAKMGLGELVGRLAVAAPGVPVLCLSQYGDPEVVGEAILNQARAFLLKEEVQMALASAIALCRDYDFIYTSGIERQLDPRRMHIPVRRRHIRPWHPHPELDNRHLRAIWLHVVYGMSVRLAAMELGLSENSVNTYISDARDILRVKDFDNLLDLTPSGKRLPVMDRTYLLFTEIVEQEYS